MKATLVTITATAVVPDGHLPAGLTLPDFAYRCCAGLMNLESLTVKARPATREERERNAHFLDEWALNLAAWEHIHGRDALPATILAGKLAQEMICEAPTEDTGAEPTGAEKGGES